jgi:hypothetical protein
MAAIVIEPIERADTDADDGIEHAPVAEEQAGTLADDEGLTALRDKLVGDEE